jgi:NADH:ubiquinone oxidoreductase subunit F (NADH-binding)
MDGPKGWPSILLERASAADPTDRRRTAVRAGAFDGLRACRPHYGTIRDERHGSPRSGLRGRGGAGFPAAAKWAPGGRDGRAAPLRRGQRLTGADPATRTDEILLEHDPFAVIEGAAIARSPSAQREVIIAVRSDATTRAIARLGSAIGSATEAGFIGFDILGSAMDITVTVRPVQGAYMLGEETVLLKALAGKRGQPEQRPPHPAESGLDGMPTLVHNVQTLAAVPWIMRNGAAAFAAIGSAGEPGTILVQVRTPSGDGIAEVPLGTPLREVIGLGGRLPASRSIKAVLGRRPVRWPVAARDARHAVRVRHAACRRGAHRLGLRGRRRRSRLRRRSRPAADPVSAPARRAARRSRAGSGPRRLVEIADRVVEGRPKPTDMTLLEDLSADIVASALCDHERLTTLPLSSGMRYFRSELDEHILHSACPAGVCHPIAVAAGATR